MNCKGLPPLLKRCASLNINPIFVTFLVSNCKSLSPLLKFVALYYILKYQFDENPDLVKSLYGPDANEWNTTIEQLKDNNFNVSQMLQLNISYSRIGKLYQIKDLIEQGVSNENIIKMKPLSEILNHFSIAELKNEGISAMQIKFGLPDISIIDLKPFYKTINHFENNIFDKFELKNAGFNVFEFVHGLHFSLIQLQLLDFQYTDFIRMNGHNPWNMYQDISGWSKRTLLAGQNITVRWLVLENHRYFEMRDISELAIILKYAPI